MRGAQWPAPPLSLTRHVTWKCAMAHRSRWSIVTLVLLFGVLLLGLSLIIPLPVAAAGAAFLSLLLSWPLVRAIKARAPQPSFLNSRPPELELSDLHRLSPESFADSVVGTFRSLEFTVIEMDYRGRHLSDGFHLTARDARRDRGRHCSTTCLQRGLGTDAIEPFDASHQAFPRLTRHLGDHRPDPVGGQAARRAK